MEILVLKDTTGDKGEIKELRKTRNFLKRL